MNEKMNEQLNKLKVFQNEQFGDVRVVERDGEPWFVAADVCRALEIDRTQTRRLDEDEKSLCSTQTPGGQQEMTIVNEPGLYTLVLGSRKPEAKTFRRWITHEVIPAVRKTGSYSVALSPAEQLLAQAQILVDQEKRMSAVEDKVQHLEAKMTTRQDEGYTIAGYASLLSLKVDWKTAKALGIKATMLSRRFGYGMSKVKDARYGEVNVYHEDVLKDVFLDFKPYRDLMDRRNQRVESIQDGKFAHNDIAARDQDAQCRLFGATNHNRLWEE